VGEIADDFAAVLQQLDRRPVVIGHAFGGLITQVVAGRGLAMASVAIDPVPSRGVPVLPLSSLKSAFPVLGNPRNRHRAVPLSYDQFRYAFADAVSEDEARELYETYAVPASGIALFPAASIDLEPWTEVRVDTHNPDRGPMLIISAKAPLEQQERYNPAVTEFVVLPDRGHALTIDTGWREICDTALDFVERFTP
jgi:pimeloyl-ACP methyl ester carboxylesterase